jgi:predicted transcriptional regulator of viral defense system
MGGKPMGKREQLDTLLLENNGYLKTADAIARGISRPLLRYYVRKMKLERAAHGLYQSPDTWDDAMYILQYRYPKAIFSHESAAFLLDLAEREPMENVVTLPQGTRATELTREGVRVHKVNDKLFNLGLTSVLTPTGHTVRAYDAERTICDLFRNRNSGDMQDLQSTVRAYLRSKKKNIPKLLRYAEDLSIDSVIKNYLEAVM